MAMPRFTRLVNGLSPWDLWWAKSSTSVLPSTFPTHSPKCHQHYIFWQLAAYSSHTDLVTVMANFSKSLLYKISKTIATWFSSGYV